MSAPEPLLNCQALEAGYGVSQVLFGIDLQILENLLKCYSIFLIFCSDWIVSLDLFS